jgi:hypothetical protein
MRSSERDFLDLFTPRNLYPALSEVLGISPFTSVHCVFATLVYERNNQYLLLGHPISNAGHVVLSNLFWRRTIGLCLLIQIWNRNLTSLASARSHLVEMGFSVSVSVEGEG